MIEKITRPTTTLSAPVRAAGDEVAEGADNSPGGQFAIASRSGKDQPGGSDIQHQPKESRDQQ